MDLNDDTFLIYAAKVYDKPHLAFSEFEEDLKRVKYVKRLIRKYRQTKDLKERLILNHIIVLGNVFGIEPTVRLLFYRMDKQDYPVLKTFLLFLSYMPKVVTGIKGKDLNSSDITVDFEVGKILRGI